MKTKKQKKFKKGKKNCVSLGVRVFISLLGLNNKLSKKKKIVNFEKSCT